MVSNEIKPSHFPVLDGFVAYPVLSDLFNEEVNTETEMPAWKAAFYP